jgi:hypothetical protein
MALTKVQYENLANGTVQAYGTSAVKPIFYNSKTIGEDITIDASHNAGSFGPVEILEGFTVELAANSTWTIV